MSVTAIIVAAGTSTRMGFDKLAAPLNGMPVLARTVAAFMACEEISAIILVGPEGRLALLGDMELTKPLSRVDGGAERHLSVAAGLAAVPPECELIAIHDAARPLVSHADLTAVIAAAREHSAASLARRVTETLKRSDQDDFTSGPVARENLWFIETPQIFRADIIQSAYSRVLTENLQVTDETSALEACGRRVKLVASTSPNPKITTPVDLALCQNG